MCLTKWHLSRYLLDFVPVSQLSPFRVAIAALFGHSELDDRKGDIVYIVFLSWNQRTELEERALLMSLGNPASTCLCKCCLLELLWVCRCVHGPLYAFNWETMCAQASASMSSKGSCYSWPLRPATFSLHWRRLGRCQWYLPVKIGQIRVASGSSVPHVTGHACTQVHAHNTKKHAHTAKQTCRGRCKHKLAHIHICYTITHKQGCMCICAEANTHTSWQIVTLACIDCSVSPSM